jgi:microcystin degradation protein MlrC
MKTSQAPQRPLRLAFGRFAQETNCLTPLPTELRDFEATHLLAGAELLAACGPDRTEAEGFLKNAELSGFVKECRRRGGVELVPLVSAWAVPAGPLTTRCFEELLERILRPLREAGPLDGVYLCLHGAMGVEGMEEAEGEILRRVRALVGPAVPVVVTFDLHGNLTREVMQHADAVIAYATNPHRDHASTGRKAARALIGAAREGTRLTMAWRTLPMLLGGGTTLDFFPPLLDIFRRMRALERRGEILSASVLTCHPWNKHPELGWSVVVVTDGDEQQAERIADELAGRAWGVRHRLPPRFDTPELAIARAKGARLRRKLGVVTLADASDVVSAGAYGESTALLGALLEKAQGLLCYHPIRDAEVVEQVWHRQIGDTVEVSLGGKVDPARNAPLAVRAVLEKKSRSHGVERTLVLAVGTVKIVVVEGPCLAIRPAFFENAGLSPWQADIIVVKNFFPFRMFFLPLSRLTIYVRTRGVTDFDAAFDLRFAGPMHPRDHVADWREADRRRRLGAHASSAAPGARATEPHKSEAA